MHMFGFYWLRPLGHDSHQVAMSVCMFLTLWNTDLQVSWRPLVKERISNIGLWWQNFQKRGILFCLRLLKRAVLDQPTVDSGGVSRGRSVAMVVGCWLFAFQWHFISPSMALPQHFHGTYMSHPQHKKSK